MTEQPRINRRTFVGGLGLAVGAAAARRLLQGGDTPTAYAQTGSHSPLMDGLAPVPSGGTFVYEFDAEPFGLHLYHCHTIPFRRHIHKGLYGAFMIDPPSARPPAKELVMVMNAFDTNFDAENEF